MKVSLPTIFANPREAIARGRATATEGMQPLSPRDRIAAQKLQQAQEAARNLRTATDQSRDAEKARAAAKVKELRARLQMLKLAFANDPKKLAAIATQIARELAAAVQSYRAAGGAASDVSTGAAQTAAAPIASTGDQPGKPEDPSQPVASEAAAITTDPEEAGEAGEKREDAEKARAAERIEFQMTDKRGRHTIGPDRDAELVQDARALARELKALLRRKHAMDRNDPDIQSAERSLNAVDQTIGALPMAEAAVS